MASEIQSNSPRVLLRFDVFERSVSLSDLLDKTATLREDLELQKDTPAILVIAVDESENWQEVMLFSGTYRAGELIHFDYLSAGSHSDDLQAA